MLGTSVSADVVDKIIGNIVVKDDANIEEIGVDDVAIRKGQKYATAINNVIPNCVQVADRFHLFQNLIENLKDIFYSEIPEKIFIKDGKITDKPVAKVRKELANIDSKILETLNYDNSIPIDKNGNEIVYDNKLRNFDSKQYIEQKQRRIEKKQMGIKLR